MENIQNWQNQPRVERRPKETSKSTQVVRHHFGATRWNVLDITMVVATVAVAVMGMLLIINMSNKTAQVNTHLSEMTASLTKTKNENNDLKQEIGAMTNNDHLSEVAHKENLSINHDNVRNVR